MVRATRKETEKRPKRWASRFGVARHELTPLSVVVVSQPSPLSQKNQSSLRRSAPRQAVPVPRKECQGRRYPRKEVSKPSWWNWTWTKNRKSHDHDELLKKWKWTWNVSNEGKEGYRASLWYHDLVSLPLLKCIHDIVGNINRVSKCPKWITKTVFHSRSISFFFFFPSREKSDDRFTHMHASPCARMCAHVNNCVCAEVWW